MRINSSLLSGSDTSLWNSSWILKIKWVRYWTITPSVGHQIWSMVRDHVLTVCQRYLMILIWELQQDHFYFFFLILAVGIYYRTSKVDNAEFSCCSMFITWNGLLIASGFMCLIKLLNLPMYPCVVKKIIYIQSAKHKRYANMAFFKSFYVHIVLNSQRYQQYNACMFILSSRNKQYSTSIFSFRMVWTCLLFSNILA